MAEAARNQLPSGYDEDFVNAVEEDFQCLICHLPLKEPVQTRCGHRFCKECLEEYFGRCGFELVGYVAALAKSRMNGSLPFERTIEQTTGTMTQNNNNSLLDNTCFTRVATLLG